MSQAAVVLLNPVASHSCTLVHEKITQTFDFYSTTNFISLTENNAHVIFNIVNTKRNRYDNNANR